MSTKNSSTVLIVGAGPAGLIAALCLAKCGVKARIIDKAEFHTGSRGFGLQPRTFELFQSLGLLPDVIALATPIPTMRAYKLPGGVIPVKTWELYEHRPFYPDRPWSSSKCLSQAVLEQIFRDHLAKHSIFVEIGVELISFEQDDNVVSATILNHCTGEHEVVAYQYVIGADGAKGPIRKLLGLKFEGQTRFTDGMVWGDYWHLWAKPGQFTQVPPPIIMARPIDPTNHTFGIGITGQNFDPTDLVDQVKCIEFIKAETGRDDLNFGKFLWLSYFKPNMRIVDKFSVGRVFLIGDAAHVHSPSGGQGMNCSVQDASNLAWKLALVIKELAAPTLLRSFEQERIPVITKMLEATSQLYTHMVAKKTEVEGDKADDSKASGWYRWRNDALQMYGINYRWSDIVVEEKMVDGQDKDDMRARAYEGYDDSLKAGDRAPEASFTDASDQKTSLFELLKFEIHTILVFADTQTVEKVVRVIEGLPSGVAQVLAVFRDSTARIAGAVSVIDSEAHAHSLYGAAADNTVVVIRPDGFIGAKVQDAPGVQRYFDKVFSI
ncbi:FAD binding domain-containing protein [Mycena floridula]|nr:FAD binding domain-containing protein [Mycena floridula]